MSQERDNATPTRMIYCCGPFGEVGWVREWKTDEMHPDKVVGVELTLSHRGAYRFRQSEEDVRDFSRVWNYVAAYNITFGFPSVFTETEVEP